ncbi:venom prothrombin activator pseutarin-C non-catalytic subunit-like [Lethenteron reissneri]|uniref:venom prothrombin activator pseutarin-C non-catalytic subunit-like n=1 Tax=Lethenteron reissneri TaxID=7753 RepID=UPI002AB64870|nr:venom prothrombin activator pseutarin-C non-catalytic subunit-like [Lethenteron reissneri]
MRARWETKAVFVGYKDATFQDDIPTEPWQGLLGPVLRAEVGDTIEVVFLNRASKPYSMHAHGVAYRKSSEGAAYADGTSTEQDKADDAVAPGQRHTYVWRVAEGPTDVDPECLTYAYHSHVDTVKDSGSGLYGAIVVCRNGSLDAHGRQKLAERSIVLAFASDSQAHSWYSARSELTYTINGFERGHIPGLTLCARENTTLHLLCPPSASGVFSVHVEGVVGVEAGLARSVVTLDPGESTTLEVAPEFTGKGRVFSTLTAHLLAGLQAPFQVVRCEGYSPGSQPRRSILSKAPHTWKFFIAAVEVLWDYGTSLQDSAPAELQATYLQNGPQRIGRWYKKSIFVRYEDDSFSEEAQMEKDDYLGILGPIIRANVNEFVEIVFLNLASRPHCIYPFGIPFHSEWGPTDCSNSTS